MNPKGYSSQTNMQPLRYLNAAALNHVQSIFAYTTGYRVRQQRGCIFAGCTKSRPHGRCTARHGGAYSTTKLAASKLGGVEGLARPTGARAAHGELARPRGVRQTCQAEPGARGCAPRRPSPCPATSAQPTSGLLYTILRGYTHKSQSPVAQSIKDCSFCGQFCLSGRRTSCSRTYT